MHHTLVCIRFWYHVVLWIILTFPGTVSRVSRMLIDSPVSVDTIRLGVSRTLAYCRAVCLSIGRCVGYPAHSLETKFP